MRNKLKLAVSCITISVLCLVGFCSCGEDKSGSTISEPEITGKYLAEEYSEQLVTDGAETVFGTVEIKKNNDGTYAVSVSEREIVASSKYEEGYYLADNNIVREVSFGYDGRIACMHNGELITETPDEFIVNHKADDGQLYTVYLMGDSAELILATDPSEVIENKE